MKFTDDEKRLLNNWLKELTSFDPYWDESLSDRINDLKEEIASIRSTLSQKEELLSELIDSRNLRNLQQKIFKELLN